ncbi:peptidoglycan-binding protein [Candidatus Kaiserbacteria bacterium]|nr:peptidoglycan-binding protein [Candidatus Kaiserbacteria bacterium]
MNILKPISTLAVVGALLVGSVAFADTTLSSAQQTLISCVTSTTDVNALASCRNAYLTSLQSIQQNTTSTISSNTSALQSSITNAATTLKSCLQSAGNNSATIEACVNPFVSTVTSEANSFASNLTSSITIPSVAVGGSTSPAAVSAIGQDATTLQTCLQNAIQSSITSAGSGTTPNVNTSAINTCRDTFTTSLNQNIGSIVSGATSGLSNISGTPNTSAMMQSIQSQITGLLTQIAQLTKQNLQQGDLGSLLSSSNSLLGGNSAGNSSTNSAMNSGTMGILGSIFDHNLSFGSSGDQVSRLQSCLAKLDPSNFSMDNITGFFGNITQQALQNWQSQNNIVASGTPDTTGFGFFGPKTRTAMQGACGEGNN